MLPPIHIARLREGVDAALKRRTTRPHDHKAQCPPPKMIVLTDGRTWGARESKTCSAVRSHTCFLGPAFNLSTPRSNEKPLSRGTRMTRQSEGMSCNAWRRLVQPAIMNPIVKKNRERNFMKWRTVACPNPTLSPSAVTTCRPKTRLPTVARHDELSVNAQYSHEPTARIRMKAIPVATLDTKGEIPSRRPKRRSARSMANVSSSAPLASKATSIAPAQARSQNPA